MGSTERGPSVDDPDRAVCTGHAKACGLRIAVLEARCGEIAQTMLSPRRMVQRLRSRSLERRGRSAFSWHAACSFVVHALASSARARRPDVHRQHRRRAYAVTRLVLDRPVPRVADAACRALELPINPGVQLGYHRNLFGRDALGAGASVQAAVLGFDALFWSLSVGLGIEGTYRTRGGFFSALGLRLDYAQVFTGSNHFVHEDGRYRQQTDGGRGHLRISPLDLALGYSPDFLQRWGIVPALRFAWSLELPLYANEGATTWSYTALGVSVLWMWDGRS